MHTLSRLLPYVIWSTLLSSVNCNDYINKSEETSDDKVSSLIKQYHNRAIIRVGQSYFTVKDLLTYCDVLKINDQNDDNNQTANDDKILSSFIIQKCIVNAVPGITDTRLETVAQQSGQDFDAIRAQYEIYTLGQILTKQENIDRSFSKEEIESYKALISTSNHSNFLYTSECFSESNYNLYNCFILVLEGDEVTQITESIDDNNLENSFIKACGKCDFDVSKIYPMQRFIFELPIVLRETIAKMECQSYALVPFQENKTIFVLLLDSYSLRDNDVWTKYTYYEFCDENKNIASINTEDISQYGHRRIAYKQQFDTHTSFQNSNSTRLSPDQEVNTIQSYDDKYYYIVSKETPSYQETQDQLNFRIRDFYKNASRYAKISRPEAQAFAIKCLITDRPLSSVQVDSLCYTILKKYKDD